MPFFHHEEGAKVAEKYWNTDNAQSSCYTVSSAGAFAACACWLQMSANVCMPMHAVIP